MIVRTRTEADSRRPAPPRARPIFRRNAMCHFIAMALFGGAAHAATPPPFSQAWLAAKQAGSTQPVTPTQGTGAGNNGGNVFTPGSVMLQQRVQQSITNLNAAAQANPEADLVITAGAVELPEGWTARLRAAALGDDTVAYDLVGGAGAAASEAVGTGASGGATRS